MGMVSADSSVNWQERRANIAADVLALYLERPWRAISIKQIAERLGISYWHVYYSFDGQEDIYRTAVTRLVDTVADKIVATPEPGPTVSQTIQRYIRYAADIVRCNAYQKLLFLRLRDENTDPWIRSAYENRVAEPLRQGLEDAVTGAGHHNKLKLVIIHGARERYLTMLEAALALPKLLQHSDFVDQIFESTVAATAKTVFAATCTFDGFSEGHIDEPKKPASIAA